MLAAAPVSGPKGPLGRQCRVAERSRTSAANQTHLLTTKPLKHLTASRAYLLGVLASQSDLPERSFQPHLGHAKLEGGSGEENILHLTTLAGATL